jgi:biopolymer transport protein TolR
MAVNLQNRGGGGRRYRPMADINVTPMVDVMLVLLIVFMVAAPLLTVGVPVDLPKSQLPSLSDPNPLYITIDAAGEISVQDQKVGDDALIPKLQAVTGEKPDTVIYVRGDKGVNYGRVVEVMGLLSSAGFSKASLVAELPSTGRK